MGIVKSYLKFAVKVKRAAERAGKTVGFVMENPVSSKWFSMLNCVNKDPEAVALLRELGISDASRPLKLEWGDFDSSMPRKPTLIWSNLPLEEVGRPLKPYQRVSTFR